MQEDQPLLSSSSASPPKHHSVSFHGSRRNSPLQGTQFQDNLDPLRWWILICCNLFGCLTQAQICSYYFLGTPAMQYLDIDYSKLLLFSDMNTIITLISSQFIGWQAFKRLRPTTLTCFCLVFIGGWIKYIAGPNYFWAMIAQVMFSLAMSSSYTISLIIPYRWFPVKERLFATIISLSQSPVGTAIAQIFPYWITIDRIPTYNLILAIASSIPFILGLFTIKDYPAVPPSYSALIGSVSLDDNHFWAEIKTAVKNREFRIFVIAFGTLMGFGYSQFYAANAVLRSTDLATSVQSISVLGYTVFGFLVPNIGTWYLTNKNTYNYDFQIKFLMTLGLTATIMMGVWALFFRESGVALYVILFNLSGVGLLGLVPFCYSSVAESTFPVPESVSSNTLYMIQCITSVVLNRILVLPTLQNIALLLLAILMIPSWVYTLFYFQTKFRRQKIDDDHEEISAKDMDSIKSADKSH